MTERRLGEVKDYDGMIAAIRARMTEIGVTNETMDALTGLQSGYVGKLLAPTRIKNLGPQSFGLMLQSLGLKLIVVVDDVTSAKMQERWNKREKAAPIRAMASIPRATWLFTSRSGRRAAKGRAEKLSQKHLSKLGRKAVRSRWREERRKRALRAERARLARLAAANAPADAPLPLGKQPLLAGLAPSNIARPMVDKLARDAGEAGNFRRRGHS